MLRENLAAVTETILCKAQQLYLAKSGVIVGRTRMSSTAHLPYIQREGAIHRVWRSCRQRCTTSSLNVSGTLKYLYATQTICYYDVVTRLNGTEKGGVIDTPSQRSRTTSRRTVLKTVGY